MDTNSKDPPLTNTVVPQIMHVGEKAGMQGVDRNRINDIIEQASKGSLFFKRQAERQEEIHKSIERMLNKVLSATPEQLSKARLTCDTMVTELEKQRCFNRIIVHIDLDMFFAAVEILDNPELEERPVAVGSISMVATSNYVARKFGVRAAMPGFIAKKLCPELVLISPNGSKYRAASNKVFEVLESYDPELTAMSLDEAYLDLTDYVRSTLQNDNLEYVEYYDGTLPRVWWDRANDVVQEIRQKVYDGTKLRCSAGIAPNTLLSKICTDINKPNGQFLLRGYEQDVTDFIRSTPVEKVSGIGKVSAQFLHALDIKTCGDLYEKRHLLPIVFYPINVRFYLRAAMGDGSTVLKSDEQRKSKSVERTFANPTRDPAALVERLDSICEELCTKYLKPYRIKGRTVTLKLKRTTFSTFVRSYTMLFATNDKLVIFTATKNLLLTEIANAPPDVGFRLMGVRLSNLADESSKQTQLTIDALIRNHELPSNIENADESPPEDMANLIDQDQFPSIHYDDEVSKGSIESQSVNKTTYEAPTSSPCQEPLSKDEVAIVDSVVEKDAGRDDENKRDAITISDGDQSEEGCWQSTESSSRSPNMNQLSQDEQRTDSEAYPCPYCFKSFADFFDLDRHVERCTKKCNTSLLEFQFSKSPPSNSTKIHIKKPQEEKISKKPSSTKQRSTKPIGSFLSRSQRQSALSKESFNTPKSSAGKRPSIGKSPTGHDTQPKLPRQQSQQATLEISTDKSDSPLLLRCCSSSLTQASKVVDPYQCPFCYHGFIQFFLLEQHVSICVKNPDRFK